MVLCPGCKRHIFAKETSCPFCGVAVVASQNARAASRSLPPDLSRAELYAIGAAMAVSVAAAGCSSPTVVHNPDEAQTVDTNAVPGGNGSASGTGSSNGSSSSGGADHPLEVAGDPDSNQNDQVVASDPAEEERKRQELIRKKQEEQRRLQVEEQRRWQEQRFRNRPPCGGPKGPCPPYGCVFPDEACDVVRA
jgi:hypothetical protein